MSDTEGQAPQGGSSAAPGCFILGAIITVFGGLIILYTVIFFVQNKAISGFTENEPARVNVLEPSEAQVAQLKEKLFAIKAATSQDKEERIVFSKDDLNTLIATSDILEDFRGTTYIQNISARGIETHMTQPMRKMPFSRAQRHLNAKFIFRPELRRRTIAMRVIDIIPEKGSIPEQFIENYDTIGFFKLDPKSPYIEPYIPKLSRVYTEVGKVVIETGRPADDQAPLPE
jgi:hypothetical protein